MKTSFTCRKFTRLEDEPVEMQVKCLRALMESEQINPRLSEALSVSRSPSHWNKWVMEMGSGRMVEVKP